MILPAGDLIAQGDIVLGQRLEAPAILPILLDLDGLVLGNTLGELFAVEETLEEVIGAAGGGLTRGREPLEILARIAPLNRLGFEAVAALGAVWPHFPFGAPKGCPQERLVLIGDSRIVW